MRKPILIIYFSPGCDHCEALTKSIASNKSSFQKTSIAMVTYWAISDVAAFSKRFALSSLPNVYLGTEGSSFFLRNYYKIEQMPYVALYTADGNLVKTWQHDVPVKDIINKLQSLK